MTWDDLRFLLAVQRRGSLAAASRALKVNQTTVGRRLNALQEQLGTRLFEKKGSSYKLTEAGLQACKIGEAMEAAATSLEKDVAGRDAGIEGVVRITAPGGMIPIISGAIAELHKEHPRLNFHVISDSTTLNLVQGEADIALRSIDPGQPSLIAKRISTTPWGLYATAAYLRGREAPPTDLAGHDVIGYDETLAKTPGGIWLNEHASRANIVVRSNNVLSAIDFACADLGIVAAPCFLALRESRLRRVLPDVVTGAGNQYIVTRAELVNVPRIRATIDRLTAWIREQAG